MMSWLRYRHKHMDAVRPGYNCLHVNFSSQTYGLPKSIVGTSTCSQFSCSLFSHTTIFLEHITC